MLFQLRALAERIAMDDLVRGILGSAIRSAFLMPTGKAELGTPGIQSKPGQPACRRPQGRVQACCRALGHAPRYSRRTSPQGIYAPAAMSELRDE